MLFQNQLRPLPHTLRLEPSFRQLFSGRRRIRFQVNLHVMTTTSNKFKSAVRRQICIILYCLMYSIWAKHINDKANLISIVICRFGLSKQITRYISKHTKDRYKKLTVNTNVRCQYPHYYLLSNVRKFCI